MEIGCMLLGYPYLVPHILFTLLDSPLWNSLQNSIARDVCRWSRPG